MAEQDEYLLNSGDIFLKVVELSRGSRDASGVILDVCCVLEDLTSGVVSLSLGGTNIAFKRCEVDDVLIVAGLESIILHLDLVDSKSDSFNGDHSVSSKVDPGGEGGSVHKIGATLVKVACRVYVGSSGLNGTLVDKSVVTVEELFRSNIGLDLSSEDRCSKESGSESLH
jgi:hypothetical protein